MLAYLLSDDAKAKGVRVVGPETSQHRVPTVSFMVVGPTNSIGDRVTYKKRLLSKDIVSRFDDGKKVSSNSR